MWDVYWQQQTSAVTLMVLVRDLFQDEGYQAVDCMDHNQLEDVPFAELRVAYVV